PPKSPPTHSTPGRPASAPATSASHTPQQAQADHRSTWPHRRTLRRANLKTMHTVVAVSASRPDGPGGASGPTAGLVTQTLIDHLGQGAEMIPVVSGNWPGYEHVNVQGGLDRWLENWPGEQKLVGLTGFRHRIFGLSDLCQPGSDGGMALGGVP